MASGTPDLYGYLPGRRACITALWSFDELLAVPVGNGINGFMDFEMAIAVPATLKKSLID